MSVRRTGLIALWCGVLALQPWMVAPQSVGAQTTRVQPPDAELRFRRVYAPADRVDDWPLANERYVPVAPREFERLVATGERSGRSALAPGSALLTHARYEALLDGDVLRGAAYWSVEQPGEGISWLSLTPCNLALKGARWDHDDALPRMGLGADQRFGVLVDHSGELVADWTLRGRREGTNTLRYPLELPTAAVTTFDLELPVQIVPSTDVGVVTELATRSETTRRWQIQLGGHRRVTLMLTQSDAVREPVQLALAKQSAVYDLSLRGMELTVQFELDVHYEALSRIDVRLDAGLRLANVRYGEQQLRWTTSGDGEDGASRISIELPEPVLGSGRTVRLSALAPLVVDEPWRLPAVHVDRLFWQEGTSTLRVQAPLSIHRLRLDRCRQSAVGPLSAPLEGESLEFQSYDPSAGIELVLDHQAHQLEVSSGTSIELSGDEMAGEALIELQLERGEQFELTGRVGDRWILDSVESLPAEAIADWHVETAQNGQNLLRIELAEPLTAALPLRLRIGGRSLTPPLETEFRATDLRLLKILDATMRRELISARATSEFQLHVTSHEDARTLNSGDLGADDIALFVDAPHEAVFDLGQRDAGWSLQLTNPPPRFTAELELDTTIDKHSAAESMRIVCRPSASAISELLVGCWPPREGAWRWRLHGSEQAGWEAERLNPDELVNAGYTPEEEIWRIRFARPQEGEIELYAIREMRFKDEWPLGAAYVAGATEQTGLLRVHAGDTSTWAVEGESLRAVPAETTTAAEYSTARVTYRFHPERRFDVPGFVRRQNREDAVPACLTWSLDVDSRYSDEGETWHVLTYRMQNEGRRSLTLQVPPDCTVQAAWVDGQQVARQMGASRMTIELPPRRRFPVVEVHATTPSGALGSWESIQPVMLEPADEVPVLAREWRVWLPPGYRLLRERNTHSITWTGAIGQRLFGPLARDHAEGVFLPWVTDDWLELFGQRPRLASARTDAEQVVAMLGAGSEPSSVSERLTWGDLLADVALNIERHGLTLLLDEVACSDAGVSPTAIVPAVTGRRAESRGMALLSAADLALWIHPSAAVLTSAERNTQKRDELIEFNVASISGVLPGKLSGELAVAIDRSGDGGFVTVGTWRGLPTEPWDAGDNNRRAQSSLLGYRCYQVDSTNAAQAGVEVVRYDRTVVLGWGVFLAIVAWNWWRPRGSGRWLAVTTVLAVVAALWAPPGLVPLASGTLLGLVAAIIVRLLRRRVPWGRAATAASSSGFATALQPMSLMVALLACWGAAIPGHGAEAETPGPFRVFIPIDENQQPTDDYYLVPEALQQKLQERAEAARSTPQDWLLEDARYEGRLAWDLTQSNLVVDEWRASYDVQVFGQNRRVAIPLGADAAGWLPDVIRLDGSPIDASLNEAGQLTFEVAEAGRYRLDLILQPMIESSDGLSRLVHSIPAIPRSELELRLPINSPPVELETAQGETTFHDDGKLVRVDLGSTDRLEVRWRERDGGQRSREDLSVTELLWLRVRPGAVVMQARFAYEIGSEGVQSLRLIADPRLRMLPLDQAALPVAATRTEPGNPQTIHIELSRPVSGSVVLDARFLLTGASGIGNLRLPRLEADDATPQGRHLAVTVDPALHFDLAAEADVLAWDTAEFRAEWGETEDEPQLAYHLPSGDVKWSIATRPGEPECTAQEQLALAFDRESVELRFNVTLTGTAGAIFQHEIVTPPALVIESISVLEDKVERLARWSRDDTGRVVVFLAGPLNQTQELTLRGQMPCDLPGEMPWPMVSVVSCRRLSTEVQIYRQAKVRIDGVTTNGFAEVPGATAWFEPTELGRLVGQYRWDPASGEKAEGSARLLLNDPGLAAVQITTLERSGGAWTATVDCRLVVTGGLLDGVRLTVPPEWSGPFEVEPADAWTVTWTAGQDQLLLRPMEAIGEQQKCILRSPLKLAPGERLKVPRIEVLDAAQLQRYAIVPTQFEAQQVAWGVRGAQPIELPAEIDVAYGPEVPHQAYEIVGDEYEVALETVDHESGVPQIHLADMEVSWPRGGKYLGRATFDLEPAGAKSCPLKIPETFRLLQVLVDDTPPLIAPDGAGSWHVSLNHAHLPQRVQVLFEGLVPMGLTGSRAYELRVPTLGDLPIERTVWKVHVPKDAEVIAEEAASEITPLRHELLQLTNAAAQLDLGTAAATGDQAEDLQHWYATATGRFAALRRAFERFLSTPADEASRSASEVVAALDQEQQRLAQRWNAADQLTTIEQRSAVTDAAAEVWNRSMGTATNTGRFVFQGGKPSLKVRSELANRWYVTPQLATCLGLVTLGIICLVGFWKKRLGRWSARWSQLLLASGGIFWWMWLWPSAVGLLIVACSVALAMRSSWEMTVPPATEPANSSRARRVS